MKTAYDLAIAPAVADINEDGLQEVLVAAGASCICLSATLEALWRIDENSDPSSDFRITGVAIADINGDGQPEIIFAGGHYDLVQGRQSGLFVANAAGTILSFLALFIGPGLAGTPIVHGTTKDVLVMDRMGTLYCCHWSGGGLALSWARRHDSTSANTPTLLDVDGDGIREVVFAAGTRLVVASSADGTMKATVPHGRVCDPAAVITGGDIDGDGKAELIVAMASGEVLCYRGGATFAGNMFRRWGCSPGRTGEVSNVDGG